jgi:protein-disulfide isomerase
MMKALRKKYPAAVAEVIRHYPLPGHAVAVEAARAASCAAFDGRFVAFNDQLFSHPDSLGSKPWTSYAREAGLVDTVSFQACLTGKRAAALVAADMESGRALKIARTPTLLVNDKMYEGLPSDFQQIVAQEVNARKRAMQ